MKLTTNQSNWTGNQITVEVNRKNLSWRQFGYKFHLEWVDFDPEFHDIAPGYYNIIGDAWNEPLGHIFGTTATNGENDRDGKDPVEAAVKLLCNII